MNAERWQQIKTLLQAALEREPEERAAFLAAACADDESLQKDVDAFIHSYEQAGDFMEDPAFALMAESLTNARGASFIGRSFGPYRILEHLGAGGMGDVYLAEDERLGRKVALKILPAGFTRDHERVRRFQQEARAASALNHPNILTIFEIGEVDAHQFIATEFIEGETLRERMVKSQMGISEVLDVAVQVASALTAAHQAGIAHRDIKPENIMLRQDGFVKVVDFGIAKLTEPKTGESEAVTLLNTKQGTVIGTAHYMSPEQARALQIDARTDIWSLGVVLYEMVAGSVPFKGATSSDVIASILNREPGTLARFCPEVPNELEWIAKKALRKDRDERYQTIRELMTDLKSLVRKLQFEEELARSRDDRESAEILRRSGYASPETNRAVSHSGEQKSNRVIDSLAILPMTNESADPSMEYLSDGITESIIKALSQLTELKVMAWSTISRYRGSGIDPREVGRELRVRALLTGRVMQSGDQLVVKAELVDAGDGSYLWGERYSCLPSEIFDVERKISREISEKLLIRLTTEEKKQLTKRYTANVEAYHAYLKGRYFWNKRTPMWLEKGVDQFQRAIDLDPGYAAAYAGLSDSYTLLVVHEALAPEEGFAKAKAAAARALEIDETLAEAHESLGHAMLHNWEWKDAEKELKRAIALNPGYPSAHHRYSEYLMATGAFDEAIKQARRAEELDPLSLIINSHVSDVLYHARRYDEAIARAKKTLELDPNFWLTHINLGKSYTQKGAYTEAVGELRKAGDLSAGNTQATSLLGFAYAAAGRREDALKLLRNLQEEWERGYVPSYHIAVVHAGLLDADQAFEWLERAFETHAVALFELKTEPMFDGLRSDPRFTDLLRRVGLASVESFPAIHSTRISLPPARTTSLHKPASQKAIDSLAILPLVNTSADQELDYLSDGITESIINALAQLPSLRVVARSTVFRYKGLEIDPREVGQQLGARAVLTGRVRQVGDGLMIAAELIDVTNDSQLWGEHYNRKLSDIFEVQEEIAKEISERLRLKLTGEEKKRLAKRYTANPEAYQQYLRGRYFWYKRTEEALRKSIEYFNQAIAEDPSYAAAYDGLSDSYALLALRGIIAPMEGLLRAKAAARKALEIDDTLGEAHASLAHVRLHEWDWPGLEEEFKRALELNPGHAIAYHWYAEYLMATGRADESIALIKRGQETDTISAIITSTLGAAFYFARKYDQAIEQFRKALELDPNHFLLHSGLAHIYSLKGSHREAVDEAQQSVALSGRSTETLAGLGRVYAAAGMLEEMQKVLDELDQRSNERYVSPYYLAKIYAAAGDKEQALHWLEKGYEERNPDFIELKVEPVLDVLRTDARFLDLLRRVGLAPAENFPAAPPVNRPSVSAESAASLLYSASPQRTETPAQSPGGSTPSIAVLPFVNTSADPENEYFCDGLAEELINALARIKSLQVAARTSAFSFKGKDTDVRAIGRKLGVNTVLEGSVRKADQRLRITARLVSVVDGYQLWSERYDRRVEDIFEIQDEISLAIVAALKLKLLGIDRAALLKRYTDNTEAYHLYLKGRYQQNKWATEGIEKSVNYFNQAIAVDPDYALAYAGLADSYAGLWAGDAFALSVVETASKAKAAAMKALEIDDTLAEAHTSLGLVKLNFEWDWRGAEREFERALELNPNYVSAYHWYSHYLIAMGRIEEALAAGKRALELDPLDLEINAHLAWHYYFGRDYDQVIEQARRTLDLNSQFVEAYWFLGWAYEQKQSYAEAIAAYQKARSLEERSEISLAWLGHAHALSGNAGEARRLRSKLREESERRYVSPYCLAMIHLGLNEKDEAFEWLEKAYEERNAWLAYLKVNPIFDSLRSDPRFTDLLRRVGLAPAENFPAVPSAGKVPNLPSRKSVSRRAIKSLAILPFTNSSADPNMDYLSDGITESIINSLSQQPKLRVLARSTVFRYQGREVDPQQAGRELQVQAVLTGRVLQIGERLIIGTELVDVDDGSQLWGEQYQRAMADIFELQEEISGQISAALRLKVSGAQKKRLMKRHTKNTQAYELYLRGRFFFNKRTQEDANRGIECFQQALSLDPNFALAYTGLADCQILLGDVGVQAMPPKETFLQGQESAARALEIGDALAEAHGTLGHVSMHLFDWPRAESELRRALDLNPNYAQAYLWQAYYYAFTGHFDDSIAAIESALQLDPLALPVNTSAAELRYFAGRFDESIDQFHKSIELDARYSMAHLELARVYEHREMYDAAIDEFAKARELSQDSPESLASLAHCYAVSGATTNAQKLLRQLTEMSRTQYVSSYDIALIHSGLGQKEECFEWLNRAYEIHDGWMIYITVDPRWESLRSDTRFSQVVRRVGLPLHQFTEEPEVKPGLESSSIESLLAASERQTMTVSAGRTIAKEVPLTSKSIAAVIKRHRIAVAAVITLVGLLIAAIVYFALTSRARTVDSLAVLPFQNVGSDPNTEYLSDGLTESIIYSTSRLSNLKVVPRSSVDHYKGQELDPLTAARQLGVSAVMTGKVTQHGDDLSISAELIDVRDNKLLWFQHYNRKMADILAVQEEIAREISEKLRTLTNEDRKQLSKRYTDNAEAYQLYLKGRYYWNKRTRDGYQKATENFELAIAKDSSYALAYAGVADCYNVLPSYGMLPPREAFAKGRDAATHALEIDDQLAEAHTSLAYIEFQYDWDWAGAEREYRHAIELNPNYVTAHQWLALELAQLGRMDEAEREIKLAQDLDPLGLIANINAGWIFYHARNYDRSIQEMRKSLELDPNFARGHWAISEPLEQQQKYDEAIAELQKARQLDETPIMLALLGHVYAVTGKTNEARKIIDELSDLSKRMYVDPYFVAEIYVALGERDQALQALEKAYAQRSSWLGWLKVEPKFDELRADPRFKDLVHRVGLTP